MPCALEAAMKVNPNGRIDTSLLPVFAAVGVSSNRNELACSDHAAESISSLLEEPAGLWFENCGGWNCHCPEASTVLLSATLRNPETLSY